MSSKKFLFAILLLLTILLPGCDIEEVDIPIDKPIDMPRPIDIPADSLVDRPADRPIDTKDYSSPN